MTGEQVFVLTMALIDEVSPNGTIDANKTKDYKGKSTSLLTMIQADIMALENPNTDIVQISNLTSNLVMSDKAGTMVAPYGLAAHLMIAEMNKDLFDYFNTKYEMSKKFIRKKAVIESIVDVYEVVT